MRKEKTSEEIKSVEEVSPITILHLKQTKDLCFFFPLLPISLWVDWEKEYIIDNEIQETKVQEGMVMRD